MVYLRHIHRSMKRLLYQQDGQDLAEYSLILLLIVTGAISVLGLYGTRLAGMYTNLAQTLFP